MGAKGRSRDAMSLVWRLYLLVALAILPAVAIQGMNEVALRRERTAASHEEALRLAEFASAEMSRLVDGGRVLLTTLASATSIRRHNSEACSALMERATAGLPQFALMGGVDLDGNWFCRSGIALPDGDSPWRDAVMGASQPVVVGYHPGSSDGGRPLLVQAVPFSGLDGMAGGVLAVGIDLEWLRDHFARRSLPEDGSITIADRAGQVLVRLPGPRKPGDPIRNRDLLSAPKPGTDEIVGLDNVSRIIGYVPPGSDSEFLVAVGIAKAPAMAAINDATLRGVVLIVLGAALALLAAWLGSRLFVRRPVQALLRAADSWGRGDLSARTGLAPGHDELSRLGTAFDGMAKMLQAREVDLNASHAALRDRDEMLALVERSAEIGAWEFDSTTSAVRGTPNFFRLRGLEPTSETMPHERIRAAQHPEDRPQVAAEFAAVLASNADQFEVEYRARQSDGSWRWLLGRGHVVRDRSGRVVGYAGIDMDITGRKLAEAALRASETRQRLALEAGRMGVFDVDRGTGVVVWDDMERQLFGLDPDDTPSLPEEALSRIHPDDRPALLRAMTEATSSLSDYRCEFRVVLRDGGTRWLAERGMVMRDGLGSLRLTGVNWDITERKQLEQRQHLLIGELDHRVKNLLAVIQSVVQQSGRQAPTVEALQEALRGRLRAMAVAHEILASQRWVGADLEAVVQRTLAPHVEGEPERLDVRLEALLLEPGTAQSLSLALHELATNAIKYGAWSVPGGRVELEGKVLGARGLALTWRESHGPPVETPQRKGFGSLLLNRAFAYETGGKVELDWRPEGLVCRIVLPGVGRMIEGAA